MVDNIDNNSSSTTANDSFHCRSVSLVRQTENEGEMWMQSESRYEHKEIWHITTACWLHTLIQCLAHHQNSLCLYCKHTANLSPWGDGKVWQGKKRPKALYTLCWKLNPSQVESISHWKSQSPILVWCHFCLKMPTQLLTQPCHEFGQGSCGTSESRLDSVLTMDQPLSAIAKEMQWLCPVTV